jgi:phosphotransferase system enzyme I (PtsP)
MMVEVPGVVPLADEFAQQVSFFSIGTNDFIQYMLAVDRMNENVADYYCPHHPSVLRGIAEVVRAAKRHDVEVSVCGEMAHDARYVPFFVGVGVDSLSVDPNFLPVVQRAVTAVTLDQAKAYAGAMLSKTRVSDIEKVMADAADEWQTGEET